MNNKGQALVEFVLILPVFLFLLLSIYDFGMMFNFKNELENDSSDIITLYNNGKIYVIDTLDYSYRNVTYNENREAFDLELMLFLVDTYFDDFVNNDKLLKEMYMGFEVRGVDFLRVFRNKLSTYMGKDIKKLQSAKSLIKSNNSNSIYKREII